MSAAPGKLATLVFPATHPQGSEYLRAARADGLPVIAASSVWEADAVAALGEIFQLPFVHEPGFASAFTSLVEQHRVGRVYAPVAAVHAWLKRFIAEQGLSLQLLGDSPIAREMERHRSMRAAAARVEPFVRACCDARPALGEFELTAMLQMADRTYGESNEHKIAALAAISADAPCGDVVEIGTLAGKSAIVLTWLAHRFEIGQVLAIDPWSAGAAVQVDSPATVRTDLVGEWDYELLHADFICNLLTIGIGRLNYLRAQSVAAYEIYANAGAVASPEFGHTTYCGDIALLHIDGNHDYKHVQQDCDLWLPHLRAGGWLVLDDYVWIHGDGPRRVGDELLIRQADAIDRAFVCGKALFVKFSRRPD